MLAQIENYGGSAPFCDMPKDATLSNHELRHGDVLVFATDGLWDNLTSQEVLRIVSESMITLGGWTAEQRTGVSISEALAKVTGEFECWPRRTVADITGRGNYQSSEMGEHEHKERWPIRKGSSKKLSV